MSNSEPFIFLIDTLLSIYIAVMYLRFILQQVGADFYNPISQFLVRATQPLVKTARRIIPPVGKIDTASLVLTLTLILLKIFVLYVLISGYPLSFAQLLVLLLHDFIELTFNIFIFSIFLQAILSWVNPDPGNPVSGILYSITYPVLRPIRQWVPPMGGFDLSSLVALIGLTFLKLLVLGFF